MYRRSEQDLLRWFQKKNRLPLILRGARQVGKSTLVRNFAKNQGLELIEVNLELVKLRSLGADPFRIHDLVLEIEAKTNKKTNKKTVLFLDEIQEAPELLKKLRYFHEELPDLPVLAAGSLLEFAINEENFSFPVGRVEFHHLGPMTFSEFLLAMGQDRLAEQIEKAQFKDFLDEQMKSYLKIYYYVGGMPKIVQTYVNSKSFAEVRDTQKALIQSYKLDFPKYGKRINVERLARIFEKCANIIGQKVIYQKIDREFKTREIRQAVEILLQAKLLLPCYHSESSGSGTLKGQEDDTIFKLYFIDIGLLTAILDISQTSIQDDMEELFISKGFLAEQFVAQHIQFLQGANNEPSLHYWLRDKSTQKAELDFVAQMNSKIYPLEVKSDVGGRLKSLSIFCHEKKCRTGLKFSLAPWSEEIQIKKIIVKSKTVKVTLLLKSIPLYFAESCAKFLRE